MSAVLGWPPRAPRSHPVKPGAQAPRVGKGTTASGKPTGAPGASKRRGAPRGATRHAREARRRPKRRHTDRSEATTATWCRKPGQRAQHAMIHGTETGARQHQTHRPQTPASNGGVQAERAHRGAHNPTCQPGVAGRSRNPSPNTHAHAAHPSQECRGTRGAREQTNTHPNTPAKSGGAQQKPEPKRTNARCTVQPGVPGYKRSAQTNTHTPEHPSQEWRGTSRAHKQAHTHPNIPARSGGAQPKTEPKNTHPHRTPQPGGAGYKRSGHTSIPTPQNPSQEWRGAAEIRAQTHTPTPHTPARSGGVQAERAHAHPITPARNGGAQPKPEPKHTRPHRTPQPGVAGYKQSAHTSTQTPQHPGQKWRGAAETRAQAHTPTPHTPARSAGYKRSARANQHTPQHPSQEWRGAAETRAQAHKRTLHTPARSAGVQAERANKHTHTRTPQPGVAGYKHSAKASTHTPRHPSQEWRGAAENGAQAHTPTPHTPARSGGVHSQRTHKHTHTPTSQPGVAGRSQNPSPSAHTNVAHPSQEWQGTAGTRTQTHTHPNTSARRRGAQPKPQPTHTQPHRTPQPGVAGHKRSAHTNTHT